MKNKYFIYLFLFLFSFCLVAAPVQAEDNTGTVPGNPTYTTDAYYYSDQFMWKASLFVAKSDTVNKETSTINDFYRIGNQALYLNPVRNFSEWYGGARPSRISNLYFTKENKVNTLTELTSNGGNPWGLSTVDFTSSNNVYMMTGVPNLPYVPQLCDGDVFENGVIHESTVGNINTVVDYFRNFDTIGRILDFYAFKQGQTMEQLVQGLTFTINGETKSGWNPEGILPKAINGNPTNQVEWLIVYEPVTIVYVKDTARPGSYYGYAMTATDFSVSQMRHQMDWRYDETRWPAWAGQQPDAWKPNGQRQHVSRLSHLLMGNSVVIKNRWYGFEPGSAVNQGAAIPNNRWTSENQVRYGGWGMSRWLKPTTYEMPKDYEFRPDTDVIIACPAFSNIDAKPGSELTVSYEINGETFHDKIISPYKRVSTSYFKWHTPKIDTVTTYDLRISISPYPKGTINNGSEYVTKKITVRPLEEKVPLDPKVDDKRPENLNPNIPNPPIEDSGGANWETATIKSVIELSASPYYKDSKVVFEVKTNLATQTLDFKALGSDEVKQLTEEELGNGLLTDYKKDSLQDEIIWTIELTPKNMGLNQYTLTPTNINLGAGQEKGVSVTVVEKSEPEIYELTRDPVDVQIPLKTPVEISCFTNGSTSFLQMESSLKGSDEKITPTTKFSDEAFRGINQGLDSDGNGVIETKDKEILSDHYKGKCKGKTIPCLVCGAADINQDGMIDQKDEAMVQAHLDENCSLSDCFFHGTHENRVAVEDGWLWSIHYQTSHSGSETLTFTPGMIENGGEVKGEAKTLEILILSAGKSLIEIFPDKNLAEVVRLNMNTRRAIAINDIYEKVVTEEDLTGVDSTLVANGKGINELTGIGNLINITGLNVSGNSIAAIPEEIGLCEKLNHFDIYTNKLTSVPTQIGDLKALKHLSLGSNQIDSIPKEIGNLTDLVTLHIDNNKLTSLPEEIGNCTNLTNLHAYLNQISDIPGNFNKLQSLTDCNFSDNKLEDVTAFYQRMRNYGNGWNFNRQRVEKTILYGANSAHTELGDAGMNTPQVLRDMYQSYQNFNYAYQEGRGVPSQMYVNVGFWNKNTNAHWRNGTDANGEYCFNQQRIIAAENGGYGTATIETDVSWFAGSVWKFDYYPGGNNPNGVERVFGRGNEDSGSFDMAIRGYSGATHFPTWSVIGDQDDITWYTTGNGANFYVDSADTKAPALYNTHVYSNGTGIGGTNYNVPQAMHDGFYGNRSGKTMNFSFSNPRVYSGKYATSYADLVVWNSAGGQDDLKFYEVTLDGRGDYHMGYSYASHDQGGTTYGMLRLYSKYGIGTPSASGNTKFKTVGQVSFN